MTSHKGAPAVLATPCFEGSEKRIEIDFAYTSTATANAAGLRSVAHSDLNAILDLAACCIVSERHGVAFDAYVLSESSLFVYPFKVRSLLLMPAWQSYIILPALFTHCENMDRHLQFAGIMNGKSCTVHLLSILSTYADLAATVAGTCSLLLCR